MRLYSTLEKRQLLDEWLASGVSANAFSAVRGIPQSTFSSWTRNENMTDRRNVAARRRFAELREQGVSVYKISLITGASHASCRHWEDLRRAGKLGV